MHDQGFCDQLIVQVSERLQLILREPDTITRRENNTFVILIPQLEDHQTLPKLLRRLSKSLAEAFQLDGYTIHMSFSFGQAVYPYDGVTADQLLQHVTADIAESAK